MHQRPLLPCFCHVGLSGSAGKIKDGLRKTLQGMKKMSLLTVLLVSLFVISPVVNARNRSKSEPKKALDAFEHTTSKSAIAGQPVANATIRVEEIVPAKTRRAKRGGPTEKTQFDVILQSANSKNITTDRNGEFRISFPSREFRDMPDEFVLKLKIKPSRNFDGSYSKDTVDVQVSKRDGPQYEFQLLWVPNQGERTNKGTFAVSSKAQTWQTDTLAALLSEPVKMR